MNIGMIGAGNIGGNLTRRFRGLGHKGRIRWMHVGEGEYDEAKRLIQKLLAEKES